MSYITNVTANRLKINKGWKNPSFPETLPLYSRDNVFFFKLYLFLKAYFNLKKTKLIYCDLRISESYTKILYLVINTLPRKLKKKRSYRTWYLRKTTSGLKYSPLRNAHLNQALNLLYLDLPKLKQQVSAKILPLSKQKLNPVFFKKTRYKTWINYLAKINTVRKQNKFTSKKQLLQFAPINYNKLSFQQSFNFKLKFLKNEITVLNRFFSKLKTNKLLTKHNIILYKTKLNQLKLQFSKLIKQIANYNAHMDCPDNETHIKQSSTSNVFVLNKTAYFKTIVKKGLLLRNNKSLKSKLHKRILSANIILDSHKFISLTSYNTWKQNSIIKSLKKAQFNLKWKEKQNTRFLSTSLNSIKLPRIEGKRKLKPTILNDQFHKQFVYNTIKAYTSFLKFHNCFNTDRTFAKFITLLKAQKLISHKIFRNIRFKPKHFIGVQVLLPFNPLTTLTESLNLFTLNYPIHIKHARNIQKKRSRRGGRSKFSFRLLKLLRLKKKFVQLPRNLSKSYFHNAVKTKIVSNLVKKIKNKTNKTRQLNSKIWKIRECFRSAQKRHVTTLVKYQYKLGLQQVLLNYFKMDFEVKIVRPLAQFKDLKFFRLINPIRSFNNEPSMLDNFFKQTIRKLKKNKIETMLPLRNRYILAGNSTKRFNLTSELYSKKNTYVFSNTANIFERLRQQELLDFAQTRFMEARKHILMRNFVPIASLFIKYLNPQILADHIAKEFERTKHHKNILFGLTEALSALPFARAKGYRVAISGRISSSDKSRSYYINKNVLIRQNFNSKVNFASTQARARIGSFGIKVWIFY